MTAEDDARRKIHRLAKRGLVTYRKHAYERMAERGFSEKDVERALRSIIHIEPDGTNKWRVTGPDLDGEEFKVVVAIEGAVIVITVFG